MGKVDNPRFGMDAAQAKMEKGSWMSEAGTVGLAVVAVGFYGALRGIEVAGKIASKLQRKDRTRGHATRR